MKIEIVLPILNEQETLKQQIHKLKNFLEKKQNYGHEILITIVDNGSTDRSSDIAEELVHSCKNLKLVKIEKRGVGIALKQGWQDSTADVIGFMDLDFATDLKHLTEAWSKLENEEFGIVCGTRNKRESSAINRTLKRTLISKSLNYILKIVFRTKLSDGMCGFKFLRRQHLEVILNHGIGFDGWFFSTEMLIIAEREGIEIFELPVTWVDDRKSKVKILQLSMEYIANIIELKYFLLRNKPNNGK